MTKDEALKLALEALEMADELEEDYGIDFKKYGLKVNKDIRAKYATAITAIKQALAASVQKGAIGAEYQKSLWDGKGISMPPPEAPVQDSTCSETLRAQGKAYPRTCKKCGLGPCIALVNAALDKKAENARELGLDYEPALKDNSNYRYDPPVAEPVAWLYSQGAAKVVSMNYVPGVRATPLYTTPPATPDLQAELDATNRQVEILSDALAESRREIARLKAVQEPAAWSDAKQSELNDWFLSLPAGRQAVLLEDKWMLAGAAFLAGKTTPPAAQRQWVGLTLADREKLRDQFEGWNYPAILVDAVSDILKEKNT
jgi:hypothetical protein